MPVNASVTSMGSSPPTATVRARGAPPACGAASGSTVTLKDRAARPAALTAVTVTVVDPASVPRRVTWEPSTVTVRVSGSLATAV